MGNTSIRDVIKKLWIIFKDFFNNNPMFNSKGNIKKLKFTRNLQSTNESFLNVTPPFISILEDTDLVELETKIEILEMIAGFRLTSEVIPIDQEEGSVQELVRFFEEHKIEYFANQFSRSKEGRKSTTKFIQIFTNEVVKKYFVEFETELEPFELGLLYGYHPKSILAFMGLIPAKKDLEIKFAYQFFNQKVMSKEFFEEENNYHLRKWDAIKEISRRIIWEAEEYFNNHTTAT